MDMKGAFAPNSVKTVTGYESTGNFRHLAGQGANRAMIVTRFAPSPNGPLHLGHAYSAIVAHDLAHPYHRPHGLLAGKSGQLGQGRSHMRLGVSVWSA